MVTQDEYYRYLVRAFIKSRQGLCGVRYSPCSAYIWCEPCEPHEQPRYIQEPDGVSLGLQCLILSYMWNYLQYSFYYYYYSVIIPPLALCCTDSDLLLRDCRFCNTLSTVQGTIMCEKAPWPHLIRKALFWLLRVRKISLLLS